MSAWLGWIILPRISFFVCFQLVWPQDTIWREIWRIEVKQQLFFVNTRKTGAGTVSSYMLFIYWLSLSEWNSSQAYNCSTLSCVLFWLHLPMSQGCVYFHVEGCQHLLKGTHFIQVGGSENWNEFILMGYNLCSWGSACPCFSVLYMSIFPSRLPSLWTSNYSIIYKDSFTISHNCIRSNPYNKFLYVYKHLVVVGPISLIKPWMIHQSHRRYI